MGFSYAPASGNSIKTDKDVVRLMLGDTDGGAALLQDEEIHALLDAAGSIHGAAELAARALATRYASSVDIRIGTKSVSGGAVSGRFRDLASAFAVHAEAASSVLAPVFTGAIDRNIPFDEIGDASYGGPWYEELCP